MIKIQNVLNLIEQNSYSVIATRFILKKFFFIKSDCFTTSTAYQLIQRKDAALNLRGSTERYPI